MPCSLSFSDLQTLLREADLAAERLSRRLGLAREERLDLRQEFLLDLILRLPAFDPKRGSLKAFAGVVLTHKSSRIARKIGAERRMYGARPASLDDPMPDGEGGWTTRGALTSEEEGIWALLGKAGNAFAEVERRLDWERSLKDLDAGDASFCALLIRAASDRLDANGPCTRTRLYRRIKEIRLVLLASGLGGRLRQFSGDVSRGPV